MYTKSAVPEVAIVNDHTNINSLPLITGSATATHENVAEPVTYVTLDGVVGKVSTILSRVISEPVEVLVNQTVYVTSQPVYNIPGDADLLATYHNTTGVDTPPTVALNAECLTGLPLCI